MFGLNKQADGFWRIEANEELDKLIKGKNIVRESKLRRIAWLGHLGRMEEHHLTKKITEWKSVAFRPRGRHKMRWEGDVNKDLNVMKMYHLEKQAKSRSEWK
jgi:hypothetical protein